MSDFPKPIKRSKELVPLSHEHHEGLLFCWKIKQGLSNGTPHKTISAFIQWFWEAGLQEHFRKEEEVLAVHLPAGNELVQQMMEEHEQLEALIRLCAMMQDEELFVQLANELHHHIRFEERVLFPFAEKNIPQATMEAIHQQLIAKHPHRKWEDEFWVGK